MTNFDNTSYELLSAYLDGELPESERAQVESLLESSEEHRQLFNDLQSLSVQFDALPRQAAPQRLQSRIMDAIADQPVKHAGAVRDEAKTTVAVERAAGHESPNWVGGLIRLAIAASVVIAAYAIYRSVKQDNPNEDLLVGPNRPGEDPDGVDPNGIDPLGPENGNPGGAIAQGPGDDVPPESGFVFQEVECDLLMIFEYVVDQSVLENETFKNTLKMHDIEIDDAIMPDEAARKAILESAAFGVGEGEDGKRRDGRVLFSIVVADIDTQFLISQSLATAPGVKSMQADLSVSPADMQMMRALDNSRRNQLADEPATPQRAYLVALNGDLQDALLGPAGAVMNLSGLGGAAGLAPKAIGNGDENARVLPVAFILRTAE